MQTSPGQSLTPHRPPACPGRSVASAAECRRTPSAALRRAAPSLLAEFLFRGPDLLVDAGAIDRVVVAGEGAPPGGNGLVEARQLEQHVAVMILNDRVRFELIGRPLQVVERQRQLVGLEVRPAEAVEIGA